VVQEKTFRRTNQRWSGPEFDRLLRAVRLEDVTPPAERFAGIALTLERSPHSVRAKWLELRDAGLRGQPAASPAVAAYVRRRFPAVALPEADTLDAAIAAYREARRQADALLERVLQLAGRDAEALAALRQTLQGASAAVEQRPAA
jgi:hypothetical protein